MDLELINNEYVQFKKDLADESAKISVLESKVSDLTDDKTIKRAEAIQAKRVGDTIAEQKANDEIKKIDEKIEKIKVEAEDKKNKLQEIKTKINDRIEQIKQNPEMQKHLNEVMSKRYDRKLSKLESEKQEAVNKKDRLTNLKQLISDHPSLANSLKGILVATNQIKTLKKELKSLEEATVGTGNTSAVKYKDPIRASEIMGRLIPEAKDKLEKNKVTLMGYISKNGLNIAEQDINDVADNGYVITGKNKDQIDLDATLNRNISRVNRQIKGYNKNIRNHQIALQNIEGQSNAQQQGESTVVAPLPAGPSHNRHSQSNNNLKWYQFIKRFRKWNENRKISTQLPQAQTQPTVQSTTSQDNQFRDSLKYEIVRDVEKEAREATIKDAKQQRKNEGRII